MLELLQAAEAEIDTAVNEAFAEGYKAAMLEYAPELAASRTKESALRIELERERKKNRFFWPVAGASFASGFLINFFISR